LNPWKAQQGRGNRKELDMEQYAAADLHGDNGYYAVIDEQDRRLLDQRLPNDLERALKTLESYREHLKQGVAPWNRPSIGTGLWRG
jgi:hypothetical protein